MDWLAIKPELAVSIAALALSAMTWTAGAVRKRAEDRRQMRAQVNDLISQLSTLKASLDVARAEATSLTDVPLYNARLFALTKHIASLGARAVELHREGALKLSPTEFAVIAEALSLRVQPLAETYWRKALSASTDTVDQFDNLIGYGDYLLLCGRQQDAHNAFDNARAAAAGDPDMIGQVWYAQANFEARGGLRAEAVRSYGEALRAYRAIANAALRDFRIKDVEQAQQRTLGAAAA